MTREVVTTCDRCGKEANVEARMVQHGLATWAATNHLCAACGKDFDRWCEDYKAANKAA